MQKYEANAMVVIMERIPKDNPIPYPTPPILSSMYLVAGEVSPLPPSIGGMCEELARDSEICRPLISKFMNNLSGNAEFGVYDIIHLCGTHKVNFILIPIIYKINQSTINHLLIILI